MLKARVDIGDILYVFEAWVRSSLALVHSFGNLSAVIIGLSSLIWKLEVQCGLFNIRLRICFCIFKWEVGHGIVHLSFFPSTDFICNRDYMRIIVHELGPKQMSVTYKAEWNFNPKLVGKEWNSSLDYIYTHKASFVNMKHNILKIELFNRFLIRHSKTLFTLSFLKFQVETIFRLFLVTMLELIYGLICLDGSVITYKPQHARHLSHFHEIMSKSWSNALLQVHMRPQLNSPLKFDGRGPFSSTWLHYYLTQFLWCVGLLFWWVIKMLVLSTGLF